MGEARHRSTTIGCVGVFCLALYRAARFVPEVADTFPVSSFRKFVVFGTFLAGVTGINGTPWSKSEMVPKVILLQLHGEFRKKATKLALEKRSAAGCGRGRAFELLQMIDTLALICQHLRLSPPPTGRQGAFQVASWPLGHCSLGDAPCPT
jgi:hypothetical protein